MQPFHLAIPVNDLNAAREFYCELMQFETGRTDERWIDLNFFGHQVTLHLDEDCTSEVAANEVDSAQVPSRHFGVILDPSNWETLRARLEAADIDFLIKPVVRFKGLPGEQSTMFFKDPSGNALEFKSFADNAQIFKKQDPA